MSTNDLPESVSPNPLSHTTFDRCLVDGDPALTSTRRRSRRRALGLSFVIETALLGGTLLVPLMATIAQPQLVRSTYIPIAPGSPLRTKRGAKAPLPGHGIRQIDVTVFPGPASVRPAAADPGPMPPEIETPSADSVAIGSGPLLPGFARPSDPAVPPAEQTKRKTESKPVKLSEGVVEAQLVSRIEPRYPPLALETRTQGTVHLEAIISREGRIASLEVISGHPLLVQAALEAVRQWRYRPTMLDGEPVEVETTITVVFQLHN